MFCFTKQIQSQEVLLEDTDVVKGLVEFVTRSIVEVLIIGTPSRGGLLKYVRSLNITSNRCSQNVMVIQIFANGILVLFYVNLNKIIHLPHTLSKNDHRNSDLVKLIQN